MSKTLNHCRLTCWNTKNLETIERTQRLVLSTMERRGAVDVKTPRTVTTLSSKSLLNSATLTNRADRTAFSCRKLRCLKKMRKTRNALKHPITGYHRINTRYIASFSFLQNNGVNLERNFDGIKSCRPPNMTDADSRVYHQNVKSFNKL